MSRSLLAKESLSITLPALLGVLLFVGAVFGLVVPSYRTQLLEEKKGTVREAAQLGRAVLVQFHRREQAGEFSREEAMKRATEQLRGMRFGPEGKDYFWINDMEPRMVMHPYRPDLDGMDLKHFEDPQGRRLFVEMVKTVRASGGGFVPYQWQFQDDPSQVSDKVSYVFGFKPWGWVVGTGMYVENVEREIRRLTRQLSIIALIVTIVILVVSYFIVRQSLTAIQRRRLAEASLRRAQDKARRYFEAADVLMLDLDRNGLIESINPAGLRVLGYEREELIGRDWFDTCMPEPARTRSRVLMSKAIRTGEFHSRNFELPVLTKQGEIRIVRSHSALITDDDGHTVGALSSGEDITDRKKMEKELRERETRLRTLIQTMNDGLVLFDDQGRISYANERFLNLLGLGPDDVVGRDFRRFVLTPGIAMDSFLSARATSPRTLEVVWERSGGDRVVTLTSPQPIADPEGMGGGFAVVTDITALRAAHDEVNRLAETVRQAAVAVIMMDRDRRIQWVNPAFEKTFGYDPGEYTKRTMDFLSTRQIPDWEEAWARADAGEEWKGEARAMKKDGRECIVEITLSSIRDSSKRFLNYMASVRDVTWEKTLEKQLAQSHKMEAIGTLAGGIAHDFNNILSSIVGYTELARRGIAPNSRPHQDLDKVMDAAMRARDLVNQILTFSRQGEQEWRPLRLAPLVKESLKLLRPTIPSSIEIEASLAAVDDLVMTDPTQIQQIVMNLCTNAVQAMKGQSGRIDISVSSVEISESEAALIPGLQAGPYVMLKISDTGHGMHPEVLARVFDPFFTTKGRGEGTGMGLAVVHGIVHNHNGAVRVESTPGQGTTFFVYLPTSEGDETLAEMDMAPVNVRGGSESILLVDDEPTLVELWRRALLKLGYRVTAVDSSSRAFEIFQQAPGEFDLLLTDLTMPGMNGVELAEKIHRLRQTLPIIICTGAPAESLMEMAREVGVRTILKKPFSVFDLAQTVRDALDGKLE